MSGNWFRFYGVSIEIKLIISQNIFQFLCENFIHRFAMFELFLNSTEEIFFYVQEILL